MATYWTVSIGQGNSPWYSAWPDKRITRGVFRTRDEACSWASRTLGPGDWQAVERGARLFTDREIDWALQWLDKRGPGWLECVRVGELRQYRVSDLPLAGEVVS